MKRFYEPDLTSNPDSPFIRDGNAKLARRSYWMDMDDRTFVGTSPLPAKLTGLGYDPRFAGIGTRITSGQFMPVEIIEITLGK